MAMLRVSTILLVAVFALQLPCSRASAAPRPVVAVFAVELHGVPGYSRLSATLTSYLGARLGETGQFDVVAPEQAAKLALATRVHRLGGSCVVMSNLYDPRQGTTGNGATARGGCDETALRRLVDNVVSQLTAASRRSPGTLSDLLLFGSPDAARAVLTAPGKRRSECRIPCQLRSLAPATYSVEITAPRFLAERRSITISPGRTLALSVELKPAAADASEPAASRPLWKDLRVSALTAASRNRHEVPPQVNFGVVAERVVAGSRVARGGLLVGDVILEVNGRKIETPGGLRRALDAAPRRIKILIHRGGRSFMLAL